MLDRGPSWYSCITSQMALCGVAKGFIARLNSLPSMAVCMGTAGSGHGLTIQGCMQILMWVSVVQDGNAGSGCKHTGIAASRPWKWFASTSNACKWPVPLRSVATVSSTARYLPSVDASAHENLMCQSSHHLQDTFPDCSEMPTG